MKAAYKLRMLTGKEAYLGFFYDENLNRKQLSQPDLVEIRKILDSHKLFKVKMDGGKYISWFSLLYDDRFSVESRLWICVALQKAGAKITSPMILSKKVNHPLVTEEQLILDLTAKRISEFKEPEIGDGRLSDIKVGAIEDFIIQCYDNLDVMFQYVMRDLEHLKTFIDYNYGVNLLKHKIQKNMIAEKLPIGAYLTFYNIGEPVSRTKFSSSEYKSGKEVYESLGYKKELTVMKSVEVVMGSMLTGRLNYADREIPFVNVMRCGTGLIHVNGDQSKKLTLLLGDLMKKIIEIGIGAYGMRANGVQNYDVKIMSHEVQRTVVIDLDNEVKYKMENVGKSVTTLHNGSLVSLREKISAENFSGDKIEVQDKLDFLHGHYIKKGKFKTDNFSKILVPGTVNGTHFVSLMNFERLFFGSVEELEYTLSYGGTEFINDMLYYIAESRRLVHLIDNDSTAEDYLAHKLGFDSQDLSNYDSISKLAKAKYSVFVNIMMLLNPNFKNLFAYYDDTLELEIISRFAKDIRTLH